MASKTISVNINGTVFHMTESAYKMFSDYLKSVKKYFAQHEGQEEIVSDLESRMAEHFSEKLSPGKQVLLKKDVEDLIEVMGKVEDFEAEEEESPIKSPNVKKRFYRDPDHRVIAGVCAGLSNYFDVDVRLIRLIFFISIFFGGLGILAYVLLWIFVPEAQTTTEKEEMSGYKFDLAAIAKDVEEKVKDIKMPSGFLKGISQFFKNLGQFVTRLVALAGRFLFFLLRLFSIFAAPALILLMAALTLLVFGIAFDLYSYLIYLPVESLENRVSLYIFLAGIYAMLIAPLIALLFVFFSPLNKKWLLTVNKGVGLMSLFLVGALVTGVGAVDLVPRLQTLVARKISSEVKVSQIFELKPFNQIHLGNPVRYATIVQGESYSAEVLADERCQDIFVPEALDYTLYKSDAEKQGTLQVRRQKVLPFNPFCERWGIDLLITMPELEFLKLSNNTQTRVRGFDFKQLTVNLWGAAKLYFEDGQAEELKVYLNNISELHALPLKTKRADIAASNWSKAEVWATEFLWANAFEESSIRYKGDPQMTLSDDSGIAVPLSSKNVKKIDDAENSKYPPA